MTNSNEYAPGDLKLCVEFVKTHLAPPFPALVTGETSLRMGAGVIRSCEDSLALAAAVEERLGVQVDVAACHTIRALAAAVGHAREAANVRASESPPARVPTRQVAQRRRASGPFHEIELGARSLPFRSSRPWQAATHVGTEDGLLRLDLHGLDDDLAWQTLQIVGRSQAGRTVRLVHGRGLHSRGKAKLKQLVRRWAANLAADGLGAIADQKEGHLDVRIGGYTNTTSCGS